MTSIDSRWFDDFWLLADFKPILVGLRLYTEKWSKFQNFITMRFKITDFIEILFEIMRNFQVKANL